MDRQDTQSWSMLSKMTMEEEIVRWKLIDDRKDRSKWKIMDFVFMWKNVWQDVKQRAKRNLFKMRTVRNLSMET